MRRAPRRAPAGDCGHGDQRAWGRHLLALFFAPPYPTSPFPAISPWRRRPPASTTPGAIVLPHPFSALVPSVGERTLTASLPASARRARSCGCRGLEVCSGVVGGRRMEARLRRVNAGRWRLAPWAAATPTTWPRSGRPEPASPGVPRGPAGGPRNGRHGGPLGPAGPSPSASTPVRGGSARCSSRPASSRAAVSPRPPLPPGSPAALRGGRPPAGPASETGASPAEAPRRARAETRRRWWRPAEDDVVLVEDDRLPRGDRPLGLVEAHPHGVLSVLRGRLDRRRGLLSCGSGCAPGSAGAHPGPGGPPG